MQKHRQKTLSSPECAPHWVEHSILSNLCRQHPVHTCSIWASCSRRWLGTLRTADLPQSPLHGRCNTVLHFQAWGPHWNSHPFLIRSGSKWRFTGNGDRRSFSWYWQPSTLFHSYRPDSQPKGWTCTQVSMATNSAAPLCINIHNHIGSHQQNLECLELAILWKCRPPYLLCPSRRTSFGWSWTCAHLLC